ncbi:Branched-chain amino acid ABC transporter, ATP-binding protein LivF (TC 3.A.1.4.1) [Olavius sp. associated proteobacterium Delta 1]|nr:Branched-chain amino acid ABC transporter, ATP-binding protein LivF (TC 3.A.1.4.1) [Olavius sp. associated proteobacterium Delta 1]
MEKQLLDVQDLEVQYGDIRALRGISMGVQKGTIVALVGANGAGKSTLLKTISGIISPNSGRIRFAGKSLNKLRPETIVNMGISHVPEGRRLFADLTVLENLELGAYPSRSRPFLNRSLEEVYDLFPVLKDRTNQNAGSLSGGEQQMLAIARAMMSQPDILMLDEPSLGLSPIVVHKMFELIKTLNGRKVTILLVEQNIHLALKISHYAFVLKTGKITMEGRGEELLSDPEVQKAYMGALG